MSAVLKTYSLVDVLHFKVVFVDYHTKKEWMHTQPSVRLEGVAGTAQRPQCLGSVIWPAKSYDNLYLELDALIFNNLLQTDTVDRLLLTCPFRRLFAPPG